MKWYSNCYRRHLLDMHIADWNPAFLSEFDPENYVEMLKTAQIQSAMLYFQSHVGLCYFPTKVAVTHKAFEKKPDMMRRTEELCHKNNIRVVGYYSVIFNTWAEKTHPEWAMVNPEGKTSMDLMSRYGHCCPNHPEYRAFVAEQIREMLSFFKPDGMFYDMPFWPKSCVCAHCRARWLKETGNPWPQDPNDPALLAARRRWMADFTQFVSAETRALRPDISIEYNCAYTALPMAERAISEEVCLSGDYMGGDVYKTFRTQSAVCKLYNSLTPNAPFEFMTGRCMPSLAAHTITKSRDRLTLAVMLTLAHHGANFIIDAIDPVGTMDARFYKLLGEIFEEAKAYEPSLTGELLSEVQIYLDQTCKEHPVGQKANHYEGAMMASETMSRAHVTNGIFGRYSISKSQNAKAVVLAEIGAQDDEARRIFTDYVENGGTLYLSGVGDAVLLRTLTGGTAVGNTPQSYNYIAPCGTRGDTLLDGFTAKYPLPISASLPYVDGIPRDAVVATITLPYQPQEAGQYASIHSNPPGTPTEYPAIAILSYGKGTVIWSAAPIESYPTEVYRALLLRLLGNAVAEENRLLQTTAPARVELVPSADPAQNRLHISALDMNEEDVAETRLPFEIAVQTDRPVKEVVLLPDCTPVAFTQEHGRVRFMTRPLLIHDRYEIRFRE